MEEVPTASALRRLKVVELRQRLSKLSLPQAGESRYCCLSRQATVNVVIFDRLVSFIPPGIKEELISRLINYYEEVSLNARPFRSGV